MSMNRVMICLCAGLVILISTGCGDDSGPSQNPDSSVPQADTTQITPDLAPGQDAQPPKKCECALDEVCNAKGDCIKKPTPQAGEVIGELVLLRQESPSTQGVLAKFGKGEADFHDQEPLPADTRQSYTTPEGEKCFLEIGTTYPYYYDGKFWPTGPGRGAGKLTFTVQGAPGVIELDPIETKSFGWGYSLGQTPPPLKEGATTYADFFLPTYVPPGATFEVLAAGGPDIGQQLFTGGELPAVFTITQPDAEKSGAKAPAGQDLQVAWSPPQQRAVMEIFITADIGMGDIQLLSCTVKDDGSATIPAAAMSNFMGSTGIQLRRSVVRYFKGGASGGKVLHTYLIGRHARLGSFELAN
jgi:hypothetical protein